MREVAELIADGIRSSAERHAQMQRAERLSGLRSFRQRWKKYARSNASA